ncbi:hypothetical protein BGZ99_001057 [Dissophora globulifera]|uniref:Crinkler effector protein N-terminal domain-containing protein n=1 Tax=Dissophora globulifera TaxID=979702 RepID=A0A9P6R1X8_9FUNG|nr:hypothetical protein BGZ99_001057 [Dissophora globulifera]
MNAFSVSLDSASSVADLRDLIKAKKPVAFADIDADELSLWRVSIPVTVANSRTPVALVTNLALDLDNHTQYLYVSIKHTPLPTDRVSDIFSKPPEKNAVHVLVQKPI